MTEYLYPDTTRLQKWPLNAEIVATGSALPQKSVTNEEIVAQYHHSMSPVAVAKMVGVQRRFVADEGVSDSDLLAEAGLACLKKAGVSMDDLSKILVTPFLGDRLLPMTGAMVQRRMGGRGAVQTFDINGGVHSFFSAFHAAACAVHTGDAPVLIVSGGVIHHLISKSDPRLAFRYGDGAAAVLLAHSHTPKVLSTYGFSNHAFIDEGCGFTVEQYSTHESPESLKQLDSLDLLAPDDGLRIKDMVQDGMAMTLRHLLLDTEKEMADIGLFLMTENHPRLRQSVLDRLGIPHNKSLSLCETHGNTMSAMLPLLMDYAIAKEVVTPGDLMALLSVGEGLMGGGMLVTL